LLAIFIKLMRENYFIKINLQHTQSQVSNYFI
jgi:hypothetical protein